MPTYTITRDTTWRDVVRTLCGMPAFHERIEVTQEDIRKYISAHTDLGIFVTKIWTPAGKLLAWDLNEINSELSSERDSKIYALMENGATYQLVELTRRYFKNPITARIAVKMSEEERLFAFGNMQAESVLYGFSKKLKVPESGNYRIRIGSHIEELILSELLCV